MSKLTFCVFCFLIKNGRHKVSGNMCTLHSLVMYGRIVCSKEAPNCTGRRTEWPLRNWAKTEPAKWSHCTVWGQWRNWHESSHWLPYPPRVRLCQLSRMLGLSVPIDFSPRKSLLSAGWQAPFWWASCACHHHTLFASAAPLELSSNESDIYSEYLCFICC